MNLDERENYRQDDAFFQDDETRYENDHQYDDIDFDAPSSDHSISDNAEPDYGNDFAEEEINRQSLSPQGDEFEQEDNDELDNDQLDQDEFDDEDLDTAEFENDELDNDEFDNDELDNDEFDDEDLEDDDDDLELDEEDETGTDPNRNL